MNFLYQQMVEQPSNIATIVNKRLESNFWLDSKQLFGRFLVALFPDRYTTQLLGCNVTFTDIRQIQLAVDGNAECSYTDFQTEFNNASTFKDLQLIAGKFLDRANSLARVHVQVVQQSQQRSSAQVKITPHTKQIFFGLLDFRSPKKLFVQSRLPVFFNDLFEFEKDEDQATQLRDVVLKPSNIHDVFQTQQQHKQQNSDKPIIGLANKLKKGILKMFSNYDLQVAGDHHEIKSILLLTELLTMQIQQVLPAYTVINSSTKLDQQNPNGSIIKSLSVTFPLFNYFPSGQTKFLGRIGYWDTANDCRPTSVSTENFSLTMIKHMFQSYNYRCDVVFQIPSNIWVNPNSDIVYSQLEASNIVFTFNQ